MKMDANLIKYCPWAGHDDDYHQNDDLWVQMK